jgi:hypothetical protein
LGDLTGGSGVSVSLGEREVVLTRAVALLWCDIARVAFDPEALHPSLAYQVAMDGVSYARVFEIVRAGPEDRALAGEIELALHQPVRLGVPYRVAAGITDIVEKVGSQSGSFELISILSEARSMESEFPDFSVRASIALVRGPGS